MDPVLQDFKFKSADYLSHLGVQYVAPARGDTQVWTLHLTKARVETYKSNIERYFWANINV